MSAFPHTVYLLFDSHFAKVKLTCGSLRTHTTQPFHTLTLACARTHTRTHPPAYQHLSPPHTHAHQPHMPLPLRSLNCLSEIVAI